MLGIPNRSCQERFDTLTVTSVATCAGQQLYTELARASRERVRENLQEVRELLEAQKEAKY